MGSMIGVLDLGGGEHSEFAVEALVVPPPHSFQGRQSDLFDGLPRAMTADQLGLVQAVHGLSERVDAPIVVNWRFRRCGGLS